MKKLNQEIICCNQCPRLSSYIRDVAKKKVLRFKNEKYWGKPLTGFGDVKAELLIIGLAPAAHGGNRTGRMFTGDSSGDWLTKVLYQSGFASKPTSLAVGDGLSLKNCYVTAAVKCAPPKNKPSRDELENCFSFLEQELKILKDVKVILCLGKIAFDACCKLLETKRVKFAHGVTFTKDDWTIIGSYHPSRQNTQTKRLIWDEWFLVFEKANKILKNKH